jgi:plastocyanin
MSCRASACLIIGLTGLLALTLAPARAHNPQQAGWGTVKGQIVLTDGVAIPERPALTVDKDKEHCLSQGPRLSEEWVVNKENRGVQNAVVWLLPDPAGGQTDLPVHPSLKDPPAEPAVMDQPCCLFEPHVLAMRAGQKLIVKNSAPVPHNANIQGGEFSANPLIPAGGQQEFSNVPAYRLPYTVTCSIHPWMKGWIRVFDNPYFAVTDAKGNFEIKNAPAGKFRIVVWQESIGYRGGAMGRQGAPIDIPANGVAEVKFDIQPRKQ